MTNSTVKYKVEGEKMKGYLYSFNLNNFIVFILIGVAVMTFFYLYINTLTEDFPFTVLVIIVCPIMLGAFFLGQYLGNNKFRRLGGTEYSLTDEAVIQSSPDLGQRNFMFEEIGVFYKSKFGVTLVKGNLLTKINFYAPRRIRRYSVDDPNVIYIPSITTNYSDLIERIEQQRNLRKK